MIDASIAGDTGIHIFRLVLAAILTAIIGFEREYRHKPAGMRTVMLIGLGTTLFTIASIQFPLLSPNPAIGDASRVASMILAGIGFLGGGAIVHARGYVHGLTTSASIWVAAAIGMTVGMGLYGIAISATVIALVILTVLKKVHIEEENQSDNHSQE